MLASTKTTTNNAPTIKTRAHCCPRCPVLLYAGYTVGRQQKPLTGPFKGINGVMNVFFPFAVNEHVLKTLSCLQFTGVPEGLGSSGRLVGFISTYISQYVSDIMLPSYGQNMSRGTIFRVWYVFARVSYFLCCLCVFLSC